VLRLKVFYISLKNNHGFWCINRRNTN